MKPLLSSFAIVIYALLLIVVGGDRALADSLQDVASKQRIGNYDVEMATDPKSPVVGSSTAILIRISGVNGDHLVDVPATIRIAKDGTEIQETNPVIVPFGHYTHQFVFEQGGRYAVYIDINDYLYSGEILTFTFFIHVGGSFDYLVFVIAPVSIGIAVALVLLLAFVKKKRSNKKEASKKAELKQSRNDTDKII